MNQLEPCPHCHRHVLVSETSCPFCTQSLADAFANVAPRVFPQARLGRAAMFAFGIAAMTQGACGEDGRPPPDAAIVDAGLDGGLPDAADDDGGVAIYSAAPTAAPTPNNTTTSKG